MTIMRVETRIFITGLFSSRICIDLDKYAYEMRALRVIDTSVAIAAPVMPKIGIRTRLSPIFRHAAMAVAMNDLRGWSNAFRHMVCRYIKMLAT